MNRIFLERRVFMAKIKFNKMIAFCMSIMAVIVLFTTLPSSKLQVSAETSTGESYMVKYAKDDNTYYFATETRTLSQGFIITPLGYFCSVYKTDGTYMETVFVTNSTEGQAYYNNNYATYKYRIPKDAIMNKLSDATFDFIDVNSYRLVFDTLLTVAYTDGTNVYPDVTLGVGSGGVGAITVSDLQYALSSLNSHLGKYSTSITKNEWTTMGDVNSTVYLKKSKAFGTYSTLYREDTSGWTSLYSTICVSSSICTDATRKQDALGSSNYTIKFSQDMYNGYGWFQADSGSTFVGAQFGSKQQIIAGYFAVPMPPEFTEVTITNVDLQAYEVNWVDTNGNGVSELVEGNTYYPVYKVYNNSNCTVKAIVSAWDWANWQYDINNKECDIGAYSYYEIKSDYPVTINYSSIWNTSGQRYSSFQYGNTYKSYENVYSGTETLLCSKLTIKVADTTNFKDTDEGNNTRYWGSPFRPKQPSLEQTVSDTGVYNTYNNKIVVDSSIAASMEQRMVYSGQELTSTLKVINNSSFKTKLNLVFKSLIPNLNNGVASYGTKTDYAFWSNQDDWSGGAKYEYCTGDIYGFNSKFRPCNLVATNDAYWLYYHAIGSEKTYGGDTHGWSIDYLSNNTINDVSTNIHWYNTKNASGYEYHQSYTRNIESYHVVPTDVRAIKGDTGTSDNTYLYLEDKDGNKIDSSTKLKDGQKVRVVSKFYNETIVPVAVTIRTRNANASGLEYDNAFINNVDRLEGHNYHNDSDPEDAYVNEQTVVIPAKTTITVKSQEFNVSAKNGKDVYLASSIYLYGLDGNTGYETGQSNNINQVSYNIESPFSSHQVLPNSTYRRDTKVITSFFIYNNNNVHKSYGTSTDVNANGKLVATLKIWDNKNRTGEPIADVDCEFAIPKSAGTERENTMVWFEWEVPANAPDTVYAELICDGYNNFASKEFIDNGINDAENGIFNSKNDYYEFNIVQPVITQTPDTTFARWAPSWYEDGVNYAKIPNVKEGIATLYDETTANGQTDTTKWSYWTTQGDTIVFLCKV